MPMKKSFFLIVFFFGLNFSLFAQTDSLQILEKQGDSLFLLGQNDQASRVYFRAFLKDIQNERLRHKFGLQYMGQYFSRKEYRIVFVKDSTEKANLRLIEQADSLLKMKELAKGLNIYQKLRDCNIGDKACISKIIQEIEQAQIYFSQVKHQDSLNYFVIQIIDGYTEEIMDTDLKIKALTNTKEFNYFKIAKGIYRVGLPLGEYLLTGVAKGEYEEVQEKLVSYRFFQKEMVVLIKMYDIPMCLNIGSVNFNTHDDQIEVIERSKQTCENAVHALNDYAWLHLKLEGHCDNTENQPTFLSLKRTVAIAKYLVNRGISPSRLQIEYYGADAPNNRNDSENNRALNRRVEVKPIFPIRN